MWGYKRGMKTKSIFPVLVAGLWLGFVGHAEERLVGIGVQIALKHEKLTVIHVLPDTPASKAGLTSGLLIRKIDGIETEGKDLRQCTEMIRGPVGTKVKLEVIDVERNKTNLVELVRQEVKLVPKDAMTVGK